MCGRWGRDMTRTYRRFSGATHWLISQCRSRGVTGETVEPNCQSIGGRMSQAAAPRRVTFGDVLANREFRAMYIAQALSVVGDQLARIAVALLVFNRSHSAFLTALSYGLSFVPWIIAGP